MLYPWAVPVGLILTSFGWWECFVTPDSVVPPIRWMRRVRDKMIGETRYFTYLWISMIKVRSTYI
jgi:hypothetical protein